jgi:hypothetical protein
MAGDNTELTFVRCPSCRSLVPAMSTRCRMCGATLEAGAKSDQSGSDLSKQGRVRQRTMSRPGDVLTSMAAEFRKEQPADSKTHQDSEAPIQASTNTATESQVEDKSNLEINPTIDLKESIDAEPTNDPLSGYFEEVNEEVATNERSSKERQVTDSSDKANIKITEPDFGKVFQKIEPIKSNETAGAVNNLNLEGAKPRVIIESGKGQHKGGGLSFGKQQENRNNESKRDAGRNDRQERHPEQLVEKPSEKSSDKPIERYNDKRQEPRDDQLNLGKAKPKFEKFEERSEVATVESKQGSERSVVDRALIGKVPDRDQGSVLKREQRSVGDKVVGDQPLRVKTGRLFGWMVNYSDPNGSAIEIREGKYFIARNSIKPADIVVNDPSVSSPHAVLRVGMETGFEVQDLMSERGVFIRTRGGEAYKKEEDRVRVEHGDWIRIGDVEFLVSLVAHVGER